MKIRICLFNLVFLLPATLNAQTFSFTIDNDGIYAADRYYTNGITLSYITTPIELSKQQSWLSLSAPASQAIDKLEFYLSQKMWTPANYARSEPEPGDRPYAGYLELKTSYLSSTSDKVARYSAFIGTTGKRAGAEQAQKLVHKYTNSTKPKGWDYQIDEKFTLGVGYQRFDNLWRSNNPGHKLEISTVTQANAGNFRSDIALGLMLRWGDNLDTNFGAASITIEDPFHPGALNRADKGWFIYSGVSARYRFNDMTLTGRRSNLPEPSADFAVTQRHTQGIAVLGLAAYSGNIGISFALTMSTSDYKESQYDYSGTGSLSLFTFF